TIGRACAGAPVAGGIRWSARKKPLPISTSSVNRPQVMMRLMRFFMRRRRRWWRGGGPVWHYARDCRCPLRARSRRAKQSISSEIMPESAVATPASQLPGQQPVATPLRFVTAASLFHGHDAAINIMRRLIQAQGAEVIHLGHNRSVEDVVRAALQEDADAIALSSYQGGHVEYFRYMVDMLRERGAGHIRVFGGGGGTITPEE